MRNRSQLFFPCLESPLRFHLSVGIGGDEEEEPSPSTSSSSSSPNEQEEDATDNNTEEEATASEAAKPPSPLYLSLNGLNLQDVCVSETPHEWCLLWTSANTSSTAAAAAASTSEEDEDEDVAGVRTSSFVLQSVDRKVYLTCDVNGDLGTCTQNYLKAKEDPGVHDDDVSTAVKDGYGSYLWDLEYEDASGMFVSLINTTYQRRLSISYPEGDRTKQPVCKAMSVTKKVASHDPLLIDSVFQWNMRFLSGELLFMSNPVIDKRLKCDPFGKVSLAANRKGWEVFRFVEAGNGGQLQIVSWTHDQRLLYSSKGGTVGTTENRESSQTFWTVSRHYNEDGTGGVLIQSVEHGRYLCALSETELGTVDSESFAFAAVNWELEPANSSVFYLTSPTNVFLSSRRNGEVFTTKRGKGWEEWELTPVNSEEEGENDAFTDPKVNVFAIRSCKHEQYLGSKEDGTIYTCSTLQESEYWELEKSPDGEGYIVVSYLHGDRQLYCDESGKMSTSSTECQAWRLNPRMPGSISKNQMAMAGFAAAATLLVASPLSLAFGIAARAPLVAMATGTEVLASYGVGAAVVGTAAVMVADHRHRLGAKKSQQNQNPIHTVNRPLVAWKVW
eukprot:scaffold3720_cov141-Cylindrotheca_fusiformis.AAC.17